MYTYVIVHIINYLTLLHILCHTVLIIITYDINNYKL